MHEPAPTLADALRRKMAEEAITSVEKLAERLGITPPSVRGVLSRGRRPNSRTFGAYARYLGVSEDEIRELARSDPRASMRIAGSTAHDDLDQALDDAADAAVRALQDLAVRRVLQEVPPHLVEMLRKLSSKECEDVARYCSLLLASRGSVSEPEARAKPGEARQRRAHRAKSKH